MLNWIKRHLLMITGITLTGCVLIAMVSYFMIDKTVKESYQPITDNSDSDTKEQRTKVEHHSNMSVLLLGLDKKTEGADDQRTDTIMVATYNNDDNSIRLVRIPRDLYINHNGYEGKINGIYDNKGLSELKVTVEDYLGIPISHYMMTDFEGLASIIDEMGGIDINSAIEINVSNNQQVGEDIIIQKGKQHLNGKEALAYSRIRYIDNDIERGKRQEAVIDAMLSKLSENVNITNAHRYAKAITPFVEMDFSTNDIIGRVPNLLRKPSVRPLLFEWSDFNYLNESYVYIAEAQRIQISNQLREHLEISKNLPLADIISTPVDMENQLLNQLGASQ